MNPWQFLRREIGGAIRSMRYDLVRRRVKQVMNEKTTELPAIAPGVSRRQRVILATSGALVVAGSVSGYYALTNGLDALVAEGGSPAGLPGGGPRPGRSADRAQVTATPVPGANQHVPVPMAHNGTLAPRPAESATVSPGLSGSPPVPTPAPTTTCTPTPSTSAQPTPSPTFSPSPSTSATSTAMP